MTASVDEIFESLSWNSSDERQKIGIELAKNIKHLSVLIMPIESKSVWENCAKVLVSKSDKELELYLYELFEWLQDMNWPGAYLIYDRLMEMNSDQLESTYRQCLLIANQTQDYSWKTMLNDFWKDREEKLSSADWG